MNHSHEYAQHTLSRRNEGKSGHVLAKKAQAETAKALFWFLASGTAVIAALGIARLLW